MKFKFVINYAWMFFVPPYTSPAEVKIRWEEFFLF